MTSDGGGEWIPWPEQGENRLPACTAPPQRVDALLNADPETGVATSEAFHVYLGGFIDLMARHGQPLTLLAIAPDPSSALSNLGENGASLIDAAIARCLRQETRIYDVVGRGSTSGLGGPPPFLLVLPMMTEALARPFAERLRQAMTISAGDLVRTWLTLSVGIASLSLETDAPDLLISRAQEALASAQRNGGDRAWGHAETVRRIIDRDRTDPSQE